MKKIKNFFEIFIKSISSKESLALITVTLILILANHHLPIKIGLKSDFLEQRLEEGIIYFIIPFIFAIITGTKLNEIGLTKGDVKFWILWTFIFLIIMVLFVKIASNLPDFKNYYPQYKPAKEDVKIFWIYESIMFIYFIGWEFLYRGFLLGMLRKRLNELAIIVQMVPFALLHIRKPEIEGLGSILAGIFLGILVYRGKSIIPCVIIHWAVAFWMDFCVVFIKLFYFNLN